MVSRKIKRYGWKPSLPDPRDFRFRITAPVQLPEEVDLSGNMPPVYDQGQLGSCTSQALAAAYSYGLKKQSLSIFAPSRLFIYFNERSYEGTINSDAGAMIRDGMKVLNKIGVCDEGLWPYSVSKFKIQPPSPCFVQGLKNTIDIYESIDNSNLYLLQQCLAKGLPFIFGFTVFNSFESEELAKSGIMSMPDISSETVLGGHAVLGCGYDNKKKMIKVRNSWSDKWGDEGYFWMPYEFITNKQLASDFWAIDTI